LEATFGFLAAIGKRFAPLQSSFTTGCAGHVRPENEGNKKS
jgi:hypothetical protein